MLTTTVAGSDQFEHLVFLSDTPAISRTGFRRVAPAPMPKPKARNEPALEPALAGLFEVLCGRAGLRTTDYRPSMFRRRAGACLRAMRSSTAEEALGVLGTDTTRAEHGLNALLVGVTGFFRDPHVFEALAFELARRVGGRQRYRVMSVGCSNGAELYSCAMLLAELGRLAEADLTGIDCRRDAVAVAEHGAYDPALLDGVEPGLAARYFRASAGRMWIRDDLKRACAWQVADAMRFSAGDRLDLVLCRNLAIYLEPAASERLWTRLHALLVPGGLLCVGKAERPPARLFTRIGPCLFRAQPITGGS
jgi:chemotaxis methyl-accepting protein methylase